MVEGAALEMLCTNVPRVRIPNSPPYMKKQPERAAFSFGQRLVLPVLCFLSMMFRSTGDVKRCAERVIRACNYRESVYNESDR